MNKTISVFLALAMASASQAALQKNFAASYGKYQACALVMGTSKCYKLYFDPEGVVAGQLTAFLDIPNPDAGPRLLDDRMVGDFFPTYTATLGATTVTNPPGRERTESTISFTTSNQLAPPQFEFIVFTFETGDTKPQFGGGDSFGGFFFRPGDFIDTYDPVTMVFTHYDFQQLQASNVMFPIEIVPEPSAAVLVAGLATAIGAWRRIRCG